jgi:hypothetical protein
MGNTRRSLGIPSFRPPLTVEQLSRHCRQPSRGVLSTGDVLRVGCVQCLHHLDAEAGTIGEKYGELGHGGLGWHGDVG